MPRLIAALVIASAIASSTRAQIIYDPVRYQYGDQTPYYYGGSDPDMFRFAQREYTEAHNGFVTARGDNLTWSEVTTLRPHVYVDQLPRANASIYGYTPNDARNDAYAGAARYFCKRDILRQATIDADGALHVAPQASSERAAGTIEIKPYVRPVSTPNRVFIFPKELLDRKLTADKPVVASAQ